MPPSSFDMLLSQRIQLPGHFQGSVLIEAVRQLGDSFELQVRRSDGVLDETVLSLAEMDGLVAATTSRPVVWAWANAQPLRLLVEPARIRPAYNYDRRPTHKNQVALQTAMSLTRLGLTNYQYRQIGIL